MKDTLNKLAILTVGAFIGSAVSWQFLKTKYERIANEEINHMRDFYTKRFNEKEDNEEDFSDEEVSEFENLLDKNGYRNYSNKKEEKEEEEMNGPYVISPEEFDTIDDYDTISLTYFEDCVLTDEQYNVITNVNELVGEDSLTRFGEFEDDSVFVRNDKLKTDYEILLDSRNYSDVYR